MAFMTGTATGRSGFSASHSAKPVSRAQSSLSTHSAWVPSSALIATLDVHQASEVVGLLIVLSVRADLLGLQDWNNSRKRTPQCTTRRNVSSEQLWVTAHRYWLFSSLFSDLWPSFLTSPPTPCRFW